METRRYDMPAVFGPSLLPERSVVRASVATASFKTTKEAAQSLLPRFFQAAEQPTVTLSRITYSGVDYLGGRQYQELVVGVSAIYAYGDLRIEANFAPVLWVDEAAALVAGREFQGLAKLHGTFAPLEIGRDTVSFDCSEYDAIFLRATAGGLKPLSASRLESMRAAFSEVRTLGWKYIPGLEGRPDADYPTLSVMRWEYDEAWSGESVVEFETPCATQAPFSARVAAALKGLPVVERGRAFVGRGQATIDRSATKRLPFE
ncbi:MAG: acetoacetate decarboxylase family protein [Burkholderiaceae bacterium]|nr:acetoacetate decarboxylase family protein [Desulfobacterales bacterium]MDP3139642.1 acetoacetate decarboxylase family protein [Burkholderiaceae bacterium]